MNWNKISLSKRLASVALVIILLGNFTYATYTFVARRQSASISDQGTIPTADVSLESFDFFSQNVAAILDRRCGNCHGSPAEQYLAMEQQPETRIHLRWVIDPGGRISTDEQLRIAYERCTTDRTEGKNHLMPIDRGNSPLASPLLRDPLAEMYTGNIHPEVFATPEDPDFQMLADWVKMEIAADPRPADELSTATEKFFADNVVPILARKTCFGANCHGPMAFMDLKLDPGISILSERFTPNIHRANRQAMLGKNTRLVNLYGDIEQSKQLLKNIPVEQGGIVHKGGNNFFEKGDPDYLVLLEWLEMEAAEAQEKVGLSLDDQPSGMVFVRRPTATPERFFENDNFMPGADLFWRQGEQETNLTASLHAAGPADIRAPSVSYDATRVAFAMRRNVAEPFNIWEIEFHSGDARQLTFSNDSKVHYVEPLYVPDPDDAAGTDLSRVCLAMTSNVSGELCQSSPDGFLGEADQGTRQTIVDRQLSHRPGTFVGRTIQIVRGTNVGEERVIAEQKTGQLTVDRPFGEPCDRTTHYVIAKKARMAAKYDAYRMRIGEPGTEQETFATTLKQMTFSNSQLRRPTMRSNGEVFFTALRTGWQDGRPLFNGTVFRTHVDGSNFHIHNGSRSGVPIFADNRELPNGLEIRIGLSADSWWGGMLMLSDHQFGPTIERDNPADNLDHPYADGKPESSQHRFVPGWISLDPQAFYQGVSPGGVYRTPYPLSDGSILVAYAQGPIDLNDPAAAPNFDILRLISDPSFQSSDGYQAGSYRREVVIDGPETELWPRPVVPRLKEPVGKRLKTQPDLFGPPSQVDGFTGYERDTPAVLQLFDLPLIETFFEQIVPTGQHHLAAAEGASASQAMPLLDQVCAVRIVGARPQKQDEDRPSAQYIIAEIPLEEDGSFYVELPSGVSFDMQSLNAEGMALRHPNRWLYCQPGEKHTLSIPRVLYSQTCGGCHGGFTGRNVDTLRRPDVITSASRTQAMWDSTHHKLRKPANYSPGTDPSITTVNFEQDIRPLLQGKCVSCHSQRQQDAGLDLSGEGAFETLRTLVEHREALSVKSYLIEKLYGQELHAPRKLVGETPHPSQYPLSKEELQTFIRWIDLGASRGAVTP